MQPEQALPEDVQGKMSDLGFLGLPMGQMLHSQSLMSRCSLSQTDLIPPRLHSRTSTPRGVLNKPHPQSQTTSIESVV